MTYAQNRLWNGSLSVVTALTFGYHSVNIRLRYG